MEWILPEPPVVQNAAPPSNEFKEGFDMFKPLLKELKREGGASLGVLGLLIRLATKEGWGGVKGLRGKHGSCSACECGRGETSNCTNYLIFYRLKTCKDMKSRFPKIDCFNKHDVFYRKQ